MGYKKYIDSVRIQVSAKNTRKNVNDVIRALKMNLEYNKSYSSSSKKDIQKSQRYLNKISNNKNKIGNVAYKNLIKRAMRASKTQRVTLSGGVDLTFYKKTPKSKIGKYKKVKDGYEGNAWFLKLMGSEGGRDRLRQLYREGRLDFEGVEDILEIK